MLHNSASNIFALINSQTNQCSLKNIYLQQTMDGKVFTEKDIRPATECAPTSGKLGPVGSNHFLCFPVRRAKQLNNVFVSLFRCFGMFPAFRQYKLRMNLYICMLMWTAFDYAKQQVRRKYFALDISKPQVDDETVILFVLFK